MAVITASPKNFSRLLELQENANQNLHSIRSILEMSRAAEIATLVETKRIDDDGDRLEKIEKDTLEVDKQILETQKKMLEQLKEAAKAREKDVEDISRLAQGVATFKSLGERISGGFQSFKSKFSADNLRKSVLSATNVGGINNRRLAREDFIQQQQTLGATGSRAELKEKFEGAQTAAKSVQANEAELQKLKKTTGLSEEQLANTERGKALLQKREQSASEFSKFDVRAGLVSSGAPMTNIQPMTPSTAAQSAGESQEAQIEASRKMSTQTELLQKIEQNTRPGGEPQKATAAAAGDSGGLLGGLGKSLKALGTGIGRGFGVILSGIGKGLFILSKGLVALTPAIPVIGVLTLAAIGLGKALQLAAPAIEAFAPVLMKLAEVIGGVVIAAIEKLPEIFRAVGDVVVGIISAISDGITGIIDSVTSSIERLAAIDGNSLLSVGAGLVAVAGGLAAFGVGSAVAGVSNLVGGLLGAVTPGGGPVEQILKLGESGPNIEKAGIGVEKLAGGLKAFSGIDTEKIKAIAAMPVEKIAAMGAAMQTPAAGVAAGSAQNQAARMAAQSAGGGGQTNVVNAPVNNVTQQTNLIKSPIRNQESSQSRYLNSRWAVV
jgi:hypothetical protein